MAIVREPDESENLKYLATVALFCGISCTILMLRFRGFKASLNLSSGKNTGKEHYELAPQVSVNGAYRTSRQEYFGNNNYFDPPKRITPSMVKLPPNAHVKENIKPSRSTGDLSRVSNQPVELHKSTPNISVSVSNATKPKDAKSQLKEQKRLEKERLAEQKKREKLAAQDREKQEKLKREREKQEAQQRAKETKEREKERKKKVAPQPNQKTIPQRKATTPQKATAPQPKVIPSQQTVASKPNAPPPPPQMSTSQQLQPNTSSLFQKVHSTNTLESSISRSSGPPPYSDPPVTNNDTVNSNFTIPAESSSWDMISQHRQQMSRTTGASTNKPKQTHLDLHYNIGNMTNESRTNSDA